MRKTFSFCILAVALYTAVAHPQDPLPSKRSDPGSVDTLKRALAMSDADNTLDDHSRRAIKEYIIQRWFDDRRIAMDENEDNVRRAVDSWYANDRDWRKIPPEIWNKLRAADKGRLKLGIDPEAYLSSPCPTSSPHPASPR